MPTPTESYLNPGAVLPVSMPVQDESALEAMLDPQHPTKVKAREWADQHLPTADDLSPGQLVDRDMWRRAGEFGLLGTHVSTDLGGSQVGPVTGALIYEGLGSSRSDNGVIFALASQALAANRAIASSANEQQRDRFFPALVNGEMFATFAMSEENAGSHPWTMNTVATAQDDGSWVLNGEKMWSTLGPICDVALVFAATDPSRGQWGISAFLVEASFDGFERSEPIEKMGLKACPFGRLTFDDCVVPAAAMLGRPGSGAAIFTRIVEAERAFLYASQIGATEALIERATHQARSRHQGGTHIGAHQSVSHRLVDMKVQHEATRLLLYKAAALAQRGDSSTLAASLTKIMAANTGINGALDAMRTFGASGYTIEQGLEAELRDALAGLAFSGTVDVTKNIVASMMGLNRPITA